MDAKKAQEAAKKEAAELFKTVVNETKVPIGVDPKSVLCEFFKAGKSDTDTPSLLPACTPQCLHLFIPLSSIPLPLAVPRCSRRHIPCSAATHLLRP